MASPQESISSSSVGGQYEKLLATVGNLQGDLQRTLGVCQSLGSENEKLKTHYDKAQAELIRLREKHSSTRAQLLEAVESRVMADQATEALVQKWRVQMEARTRELEALQARLEPQDIDMLRAKVQEELDVPHRRRLEALEAEVEKFRQMFFNVRREYERCKAEYEQYTLDQAKEMETKHQQYKTEGNALKLRIQHLESSLADASHEDEVRKLRCSLEEASAVEAQLHSEMSTIRKEKESLEVDRQNLVLRHRGEVAAAQMKESTIEADKQTLQRRCAALEEEASRRRRQLEVGQERLEEAVGELSRVKEVLAGRDRSVTEARAEAKCAADKLVVEWGREKAEMKATNEALEKRAALAESRAREALQQAAERVRGAQQIEERSQHEAQAKNIGLRQEVDRLEAEVERLGRAMSAAEVAAESGIRRWRGDAERAVSETSRALREKEALRERVSVLQVATDKAVAAAADASVERDEARLLAAAAEAKAATAVEELARVEEEGEVTQDHLRAAEEELAGLSLEADQAHEAQIRTLKELKCGASEERDAHAARCKQELDTLRKRARRAVRKERKKSHAYKAQAIEAHRRGVKARQALRLGVQNPATAQLMALDRTSHTKVAEPFELSNALQRLRYVSSRNEGTMGEVSNQQQVGQLGSMGDEEGNTIPHSTALYPSELGRDDTIGNFRRLNRLVQSSNHQLQAVG
ncbi:unnamed protein product [Choristocarpus tenellus]